MHASRLAEFWAAFRAGSFDHIFSTLMTPEVEFVMPGMPPLRGADAIRPLFAAYREAFPDMRGEVLAGAESGELYLAETRYSATHAGALAGPQGVIPASGRTVSWTSADIVRFAGGRIASWHVYHDPMALFGSLLPR